MRNAHNQAVVWVTVADRPRVGGGIYGGEYDDPDLTLAIGAGPFDVRDPFGVHAAQFALQSRAISRLVDDTIAFALKLIVPHGNDDSLPILANRGPAEAPAGAYSTEVSEAFSQSPKLQHFAATRLTTWRKILLGSERYQQRILAGASEKNAQTSRKQVTVATP